MEFPPLHDTVLRSSEKDPVVAEWFDVEFATDRPQALHVISQRSVFVETSPLAPGYDRDDLLHCSSHLTNRPSMKTGRHRQAGTGQKPETHRWIVAPCRGQMVWM